MTTGLAGRVKMLDGKPLEGVTLQIDNIATKTDANGRFILSSILPGHHELFIDGRTASTISSNVYGIFEVGVDLLAEMSNVLPYVIWMPEIDKSTLVTIPSPTTDDVVLTTPHIPGLEVHIPSGTTIIDDDGNNITQIGITPIPIDRPPFPLPRGVEVPIFFTVQPGGAYIYPNGARIFYPNYTKKPPGTRRSFWNYDPRDRGWYIYGYGTVTPDGKQVIPDLGVAIYEFTGAMINDPDREPPPGSGPPPGQESGSPAGVPFPETPKMPPSLPPRQDDGDPADLATGLFVLKKTDMILPDVIPIVLTRTYRPDDTASRCFGIGSTHPYDMFLFSERQYEEADLILPDGGRIHYVRISPGSGFADAEFEHKATPTIYYASRIKWNGNGWDLTLRNGTTYVFGDIAPLYAIRDRYGNTITITRSRLNQFNSPTGNITQIKSPNGRWIQFSYDSSDRITQASDNIGRKVTYSYDSDGRLSSVEDPAGGVTEYAYDNSHRMISIKDAKGIVFLRNQYDTDGRVVEQVQADGSKYQFVYTTDTDGRVIQTIVTDPLSNIRKLDFNPHGYIVAETRALGKPEEQTSTCEYQDETNLLLSVTDPVERKIAFTYDSAGNVTSITHLPETPDSTTSMLNYGTRFNLMTSFTDAMGKTVSFDYDEKGNLTHVTDPLLNETIFSFDTAGKLISVADPLGNISRFAYDFGIRSSMTNPLGAASTRHIDNAGRPIILTDRLGQPIRYAYDAHNHLTQVTDSLGEVTTLSYDPNGNLLSVTDARGRVINYTYDVMDRLERRTDPLGRSESCQYDAAGNLTQFTDRKGQTTSFSYDALNRLMQKTYADGSTTNYAYDAGNRLTQVEDSVSGTITLSYDSLNRLIAETTPQGTVSYDYDMLGRRTSMTVAGQTPIAYNYDDANRLTQITQGASAVSSSYDAAGRLVSLTLPADVISEYGYDAASQLTNITCQRAGTVLGDLIYEYDAAGNRVKVGGSFARTTIPEAVSALVYDEANQLTQQETTTLSYDDNGNLTSDDVRSYVWDARNQLSSINGTGVTASFQYDAFGRRARKTINGTTTEFLYDGLNVVQEVSGGTLAARLLTGLGIDEYFVRTTANGAQILLFDALGSTVGLLDANGVVQTEYAYEPFGATTFTGAASTNPFQYTGRENDELGLYNYRARYYNPTLRRFISEDPLGFAGGDINLYAYALSSPTNFTDPLGFSVDAITVVDCLDRIREARERQKRMMETSGRKDELKEAAEEIIRTNFDMIECLLPVPIFLGVGTGGKGSGGNDTPPDGGGPFRTPGTPEPSPATKDFIRKLKELEERWKRRRWWRR